MRLLTKTSLYLITVSLFIFFLGGFGFYKLFSSLIDKRVNKELHALMHNVVDELNTEFSDISEVVFLSSERIAMKRISNFSGFNYHYKDTVLYDDFEKLYIPYRQIRFQVEIKDKFYEFSVFKSLFQTNTLVENIAIAMTVLVLLFIVCIYFLNKYFFRRIWSDFFNTIQKIQNYDLDSSQGIDFMDSMIIEFNQLNSVLKKMMDHIQQDYIGLKEFTGNISHEIQTPLAIIKSKTELLLQTQDLSAQQVGLIKEIHDGTARLSKINHALILLTKIENRQFHGTEKFRFGEKIEFHLSNFDSLIQAKKIILTKNIDPQVVLETNPELADILVMNLLKNAIRHNIEGGEIKIRLAENQLTVYNTGNKLNFEPEKIFERFSKNPVSKGSIGLGLAIVKKICDYCQFGLNYSYSEGWHVFTIRFGS